MNLTVDIDSTGADTTTLIGTLKDQAHLVGLLTRLFDQGYPILSVEHLPTPDTPA